MIAKLGPECQWLARPDCVETGAGFLSFTPVARRLIKVVAQFEFHIAHP